MPKVFVSYSRDDSRKVKRIIRGLEAHGLKFWMDTSDLKSGDDWTEKITKAINGCQSFLLLMSDTSMASDNVEREVHIAFKKKKRVVILRLDNAKVPPSLDYQLARTQWADYSSTDWEANIVSALGGRKKRLRKANPNFILPSNPSRQTKPNPKKPRTAKSVIAELERKFSEKRFFYKDECDGAILQLDELRSIAGTHWINPAFVYNELVSREYLLDKIEVIQNLICAFQETNSAIKREMIHSELKMLSQELNRKG